MKRKDFYIFIAWVQYFGNATGIFKKMKETFFDLLFFFTQRFTIHSTAGEGGGCQFNSSLPHSLASETFRH